MNEINIKNIKIKIETKPDVWITFLPHRLTPLSIC